MFCYAFLDALIFSLSSFIYIYIYIYHICVFFHILNLLSLLNILFMYIKYYLWAVITRVVETGDTSRQKLYYKHKVISRNEMQYRDLGGFSVGCPSHDQKIPWKAFWLLIYDGHTHGLATPKRDWIQCCDIVRFYRWTYITLRWNSRRAFHVHSSELLIP